MAEYKHDPQCDGEHEEHLCYLMYNGFHNDHKEEYKNMVQDAQYRCEFCSRTAKEAKHLCKPVKL